MAYLLDANVFIEAKNRYYGMDFCPVFWESPHDPHPRDRLRICHRIPPPRPRLHPHLQPCLQALPPTSPASSASSTSPPAPTDRYRRCLPLLPLKAAAGGFGDPQQARDDEAEWVELDAPVTPRPGMFVARVVGQSMQPAIPDGAYCLFVGPVAGTRQGKTVLVELRDAVDPETGERYTVKRYESEKSGQGDAWRHTRITLKPANPAFPPIVLEGAEADRVQVVAELLRVL